jgi:hypothetical protein
LQNNSPYAFTFFRSRYSRGVLLCAQLSEVDWKLGETKFEPADEHGRKWACWNHLMTRCEMENDLDFIIVDLNPAASKLNFLAILR